METKTSSVSYKVKETGENINVPIEYTAYDSVAEAIEEISEGKILAMINQTTKEDVGNNEREKAKVANGHSTRVLMSEEEKAEKKEARKVKKVATNSALQALADQQGITLDELLAKYSG